MLVLKSGNHSSRVSPFLTLARANENQIPQTLLARHVESRHFRQMPELHVRERRKSSSGKIVILYHQQNQVKPMCGGCAHFGANKSHLICVTIVMQNVLQVLFDSSGGMENERMGSPYKFSSDCLEGRKTVGKWGVASCKGLRMQM